MKLFKIAIVGATVLFAFSAQAQMQSRSTFSRSSTTRIKPTIGLTSMRIASSNNRTDYESGVSVGALVEMGSGRLTFESGLMFNQYGGKLPVSGIDIGMTFNYLAIPVIAKVNLTGTPEQSVYLKGGLLPSLMVAKEAKAKINGQTYATRDISDVNNTDVIATAGMGASFPVTLANSLNVEGTYHRGLTKVFTSANTTIYNEGFMINLGYSIDL